MLHLLLAIFIGVCGAIALITSIIRLVHTIRSAHETTCALAPNMRVELSAGPKVISIRGPRGTSVLSLKLTMSDAHGHDVSLHRILVPLTVSRVREVTVGYASCNVQLSGSYTLTADNLPGASVALVFGRPNTLRAVAWILAILVSGVLVIGSLVVAALSTQ